MLVVAIAGTVWPSRCRMLITFSPILCCPEHPYRASVALVAHPSTCDIASTYGTGVLYSRAWVRMDIA